jgi:rod shape determining protein RodA
MREREPGERAGLMARLHLDGPLLAGLGLLALIGLAVLYSASGRDLDKVLGQALNFTIAFAALAFTAQISPRTLRYWTPWLFGIGVALLVAVLVFGDSSKGAQRWLNIGVRFQPSEILKLAAPMMLAWFYADRRLPPQLTASLAGLLLLAVPVALVARQPDLGTALLIAASGLFVLFLAGLPWRYIFIALLAAIPLTAAVWQFGLLDYQRQRVHTFLDPSADPLGTGYHIIQSQIAVGSGGLYGKGWMNGTQSQLEFIPERTTDFIFAVLAEEFGLLGVLTLLALYVFVLLRSAYITTQTQDAYSRLLAGALTLTFFVYVFINAGMVTGLLPVVGVPLPLVSYGGTAVVTLLSGFGILMSIHTHRKFIAS